MTNEERYLGTSRAERRAASQHTSREIRDGRSDHWDVHLVHAGQKCWDQTSVSLSGTPQNPISSTYCRRYWAGLVPSLMVDCGLHVLGFQAAATTATGYPAVERDPTPTYGDRLSTAQAPEPSNTWIPLPCIQLAVVALDHLSGNHGGFMHGIYSKLLLPLIELSTRDSLDHCSDCRAREALSTSRTLLSAGLLLYYRLWCHHEYMSRVSMMSYE